MVISVNSNVSVLFPICYLNLLHHFLAVMGRVIPNGQCARSMPLSTWLRPNAFKKKKSSSGLGGEEVSSTTYHMSLCRPPSSVASKSGF